MFEQSHLKYSFTSYASSLSPANMVSKPDISSNCFKNLRYSLNETNKIITKDSDIGFQEYKSFLQDVVSVSPEFKSYDRTECRLDKFYFEIASLKKYSILEKVIKMTLCLNHGQADIERGFSVNENLLKDNMKEASIISQRFIYDHMTVKNIKPESLVITKDLLKSVKSARICYDEYLSNQKKRKI